MSELEDMDVVLPEMSFDIESEKPEEVINEEQQQKAIERMLGKEAQNSQFPLIRQHIENLIEVYSDLSVFTQIPDAERSSQVLARAMFVSEMRDLLHIVDNAKESLEQTLREELDEQAGKTRKNGKSK